MGGNERSKSQASTFINCEMNCSYCNGRTLPLFVMYSSLLQRLYQQVLILDLEYALDRKVEQELWNHGFKNYIATLQNLAKDKKVCSDVK